MTLFPDFAACTVPQKEIAQFLHIKLDTFDELFKLIEPAFMF